MHPNKVRDLLPSFAMEINCPVEEVQAVVGYYYKTIRQKLTQLSSVNIHLENLGTFYIKERALDNYINKCNYIVEQLTNNTIKEYSSKVSYQNRVVILNSVKEKLLEEKERRKEVNIKRFGNESTKTMES